MRTPDANDANAWPTLNEIRKATGTHTLIIRQCLTGQAHYDGLPCPTELERLTLRGERKTVRLTDRRGRHTLRTKHGQFTAK